MSGMQNNADNIPEFYPFFLETKTQKFDVVGIASSGRTSESTRLRYKEKFKEKDKQQIGFK
mgnify:CR=1 FL=1